MSKFSILKYIVFPILQSNIINYIKIVFLSGLILASGVVNQYAVSNEYYTLVKPFEHNTWDIAIDYGRIVNDTFVFLRREGYASSNVTITDIERITLEALSRSTGTYAVHVSKIYFIPDGGTSSNGNYVTLWAVNSTTDLKYTPMLIIKGHYPAACEAAAYYINSAGLKIDTFINFNSLKFTITGSYLGGVNTGFLLSNNEAVVVVGPHCMINNMYLSYLFIKLKNNSKDELLDTIAYTISELLSSRYGINSSTLYPEVRSIVYSSSISREGLLRQDRLFFNKEYGWHTTWGLLRLGSLTILAFYMIRVAISDVTERMRDAIALLYSQGGLDTQVAVFLMAVTILYLAPALLIALVVSYLYMLYILTGFGILPLRVLIYWTGLWPAIGVILVSLLAVFFGLATVRVKGLSEILRGG